MNITELETPCLILDKKKLKYNIDHFNSQMKKYGIKLRPWKNQSSSHFSHLSDEGIQNF